MTVVEMLRGVELGVQKLNSDAFLSYSPEEKLYFLNKAQREYIRRQHISYRKALIQSKGDYIKDEESSENLGSLLSVASIGSGDISVASQFANCKVADLSGHNIYYYVFSQTKPTAQGGWRVNKLINANELPTFVKTEYNDPVFREYPVLFFGGDLYIFYDAEGGDVNELSLVYIRKPKTLVTAAPAGDEATTSELPEHTHDEIVNLATSMILEDIKAVRPHKPTQVAIDDEEV